MAAQHQGGGGNPGKLGKWIQQNIYIKSFSILLFTFVAMGVLLFTLPNFGVNIKIGELYLKFLLYTSYILNKIPIYNLWTENFNAWVYYINYQYSISTDLFSNIKTWIFIFESYLEMFPLFLAIFPFMKYFEKIEDLFKNYEKTLIYRNLKPVKNPIKELETSILTEGTYNLGKDEYNPEEIETMKKVYNKYKLDNKTSFTGLLTIYSEKLMKNIENYERTLKKLRMELKNEKEWNDFFNDIIDNKKQPYEYLNLFGFKNIDYDLLDKRDIEKIKIAFSWKLHFKFLNIEKIWVTREFYIDSIKKEISAKELYKQYYAILLFWLNKKLTNYSMYLYTKNLDVYLEFKKLAKWVDALNAPGKVLIIISRKPKLQTISVDLYYRLYMFRNYLGVENDYMLEYIEIIDKK